MNLHTPCSLDNASSTPDQRLIQTIQLALDKSGYIQLRGLEIRVNGDQVHLRGRLPSYYLKQLATHIISGLPGIHSVVDEIDVIS